jgi:hypothetical protein
MGENAVVAVETGHVNIKNSFPNIFSNHNVHLHPRLHYITQTSPKDTIAYTGSNRKIELGMSSNVLADRDINASVANVDANAKPADGKADVKSMEYHRQVLQSKLDESQ